VEWKPNGSEGSPRMLVKAEVHVGGAKDRRGILHKANGYSRKLGEAKERSRGRAGRCIRLG
jgi:hypothetical protein